MNLKNLTKEQLWAIYGVGTAILGLVGYLMAKKDAKMCGAIIGANVGAIISIILWLTWGKKQTASPSSTN